MKALSDRQARFVELYCLYLDATKAAKEAGYSARNAKQIGSQVLHKPHIAAAVAARQKALSQQTAIDEAWIEAELVDNVRRAKADDDYAAANRALELLGKRRGMWVDRLQVDPVEAMTDEELDAAIDAKLAALGRAAAATH